MKELQISHKPIKMKVIAMKRKDGIEKFIWDNKEDMDNHIPKGDLWNSIESELDNTDSVNPQKPLSGFGIWIAIVLIVLVATAFTFYQMGSKNSESKAMLFAEIQNIEQHYDRQTQHLVKTVGYTSDILQIPDIEDINKHIAEIKGELGDLPEGSEEKAVQALLESYKTKLMILQRIMTDYEITKSKNSPNGYDI
tara:strand:- start:1162 stop:1746 length:585 start_codon:yes stop_codon:yes gene_type:complete